MSRIITRDALQGRSVSELQGLYRSVMHELAQSAEGSQERSAALASLENISLALAQRYAHGPQR